VNVLHSSLYSIALAGCLALIPLARVWLPAPRNRAWLTTFLVLQSLVFLLDWLVLHPAMPAKALWLGSLMALSFLLAPCLWLCAREITEQRTPRIRDLNRGHLVVIGCGVLLVLPLIERAHLGTEFVTAEQRTSDLHSLVIHSGMLAAIGLFGLQAAFYLRACLRILRRHARQSKALFSSIDDKALDTLRALILILAMHWCVGLARGLYGLILGREAGPSVVFAFCEAAMVAWALFRLARARPDLDAGDRELAKELASGKYARSALDETARARIRRKLDEAFGQRRMHRDGRLTLRGLCAGIRENPHYVSQVINQDIGKSFYDLVNLHRVRDAMVVLREEPAKSVQQVGMEVGFNSKSTFNAAFRAHGGTTPSAWRSEQATAPDGSDLPSRT
jgi:AraC-like DNA-binding protein